MVRGNGLSPLKRGLQQLARGAGVPFNLREIPQQAVEFGAGHRHAS
jgi:hypothetical protein